MESPRPRPGKVLNVVVDVRWSGMRFTDRLEVLLGPNGALRPSKKRSMPHPSEQPDAHSHY